MKRGKSPTNEHFQIDHFDSTYWILIEEVSFKRIISFEISSIPKQKKTEKKKWKLCCSKEIISNSRKFDWCTRACLFLYAQCALKWWFDWQHFICIKLLLVFWLVYHLSEIVSLFFLLPSSLQLGNGVPLNTVRFIRIVADWDGWSITLFFFSHFLRLLHSPSLWVVCASSTDTATV